MSTANKLSYLNDTKSLLRTSLNKFGSSILSTDTFRSYDTKLNEIYDKLPKVTQSGAGFTLENVQNGQVDDFKMIGVDLEQDTTTGKNILPQNEYISSTTINGITYTNNGDGTFSLSGTATAETSIRIIPTEKFNLNNGQQYYLYSSLPYNSSTFNMSIVTLENGTQNYLIVNNNYTPATTPTNSRLQFYIAQGNTVNAQNIKLMLVKGNNDTNYEPYTGGIPSPNPDYPQDIKVVEGRQVITDKGKNKFYLNNNYSANYDEASIEVNNNNSFILRMNKTSSNKQSPCANIEFNSNYLKPNTTYTISKKNSNTGYSLNHVGSIRLYINGKYSDFVDADEYTFTTPNEITTFQILLYLFFDNTTVGNYEIEFYDIQLEEGSSSTNFEPYHEPVDYNIDLSLENIQLAKIPNTDYKNRIYKNNGNWYFEENVKKVILDGSENITLQNTVNNIIGVRLPIGNNVKPHTRVYCSHLKDTTFSNYYDRRTYGMIASHGSLITTNLFASAPNESIITIDQYKNWLSTNNTTVYCILDNPITTQITNTTLIDQLEAISVHTGTNIITISNSNNIIPEIEITRLKELEKLS